ncbi:MFS general substrate transporter [Polyplosphaeria fusca]|uniref:MFS general substrate transporter n=1 Tax=Polyplosphaeria fusca TaxID=682080 RepID=A0A9P4UWU6_9PLEO|nr:MFS general substrate transporter [Polyplosphaeria fusca]
MLGFHRRTRSLIPVKDLAKYDKIALDEEEVEEELQGVEELEPVVKADHKQLTLVYIIFLAEAIMASSLQGQLQMLISNNDFCADLSTSYLRSILDCAYAFGGTTGIFWGYLSDRIGRRRVTLLGLWTMLICCLSMGFATDLTSCAIFRFLAGLASSTVLVTTLTMIGDLSNTAERAKNVARLPLIALCGSIGPLVQHMVAGSINASGEVWQKFPILSSQITCGSVVLLIAIAASVMLKETLPMQSERTTGSMDFDCEKAAFLAHNESSDDLSLTVIDCARPEPISINQFLQAPSLLVLLSSFSLLSLHSSTFDVLLPHLGHSSGQQGGMGIPCTWLGLTVLGVRATAGILILHFVPRAVERFGLLKLYRSASLFFPAIYVLTPLLALLAACSMFLVTSVSTVAILAKHTLTGGATVLVALLVLNTTPDAFSAGTVVGMMQVASLFKALAVAVSGASFYLSNEYSIGTTNYSLWSCLALFGLCGSALAWFVRERPSVEMDFPSEVLCWETCFDAEEKALA